MENSSPMQNTQKPLSGLKTAILVANGFNETEGLSLHGVWP